MKNNICHIKRHNAVMAAALLLLLLLLSLASCEERTPAEAEKREYHFRAGEARISVGDDLDRAVKALGEYNSFKSTPSCASDGFDELYVYNGFRITGRRSAGRCLITKIELTNDLIKTAEGVGIGEVEEKIAAVYGKGSSSSPHTVEYVGDNCRLQFSIKEGRVAAIKYVEK